MGCSRRFRSSCNAAAQFCFRFLSLSSSVPQFLSSSVSAHSCSLRFTLSTGRASSRRNWQREGGPGARRPSKQPRRNHCCFAAQPLRQRSKGTTMKIESTPRAMARPTKPEPGIGSGDTSSAMRCRATAHVLARASDQLLSLLRAIHPRFLPSRRPREAGVCDLSQCMFELETHKLATLHLGSFRR
jgi:hypothetical protein